MVASRHSENSKLTGLHDICQWCGKDAEKNPNILQIDLCPVCRVFAIQALILGRQVRQLTLKGGATLYIAVEKTGQSNELLSAKRWSPLESLESADSVEKSLSTYQYSQE